MKKTQSVRWEALTKAEKVRRVLWRYISRPLILLTSFYFFICSLQLLSLSFQLLAVENTKKLVDDRMAHLLHNKISGVMIGILATSLLQSSSVVTSILVSMVAAEFGGVSVKEAIPIVMGANIGTSVTSTLVSLGQCTNREQYKRAFSAATIHDTFNWLSVCILVPLEYGIASVTPGNQGYLEYLSSQTVALCHLEDLDSDGRPLFLHALTKPFTDRIIQIDEHLLTNGNHSSTIIKTDSDFLFRGMAEGNSQDMIVGITLLFASLFMLFLTLIVIIKFLQSLFKGPMFDLIQKFVNSNLPGRCGQISTGYLAIAVGSSLTVVVQSSSVFISTLIPLVGLELITIERMYTLALGANIGTTVTAILGALSVTKDAALQLALCHLYFNLTGILLWYPIPKLRKVPIAIATKLGEITARHRCFSLFYIVSVFLALPTLVIALLYGGDLALFLGIFAPAMAIFLLVLGIYYLQKKNPNLLPKKFRTWDFLLPPRRQEGCDKELADSIQAHDKNLYEEILDV